MKYFLFQLTMVAALLSNCVSGLSASCAASELLVELQPSRNNMQVGDILFLEVSVLNRVLPVSLHD